MLVEYSMIINDEHIREAEKLLINGNEFDREERIPFIKNLNSCDLLAVPGSGKTTALLAKLFCLSKHLPFKDGSGILVLSHTNAAVDEIENNLKSLCPKLFEYPNFVGTIQSFVNKFLGNPGNCQKYGSYISKNDDEVYLDEVIRFFLSLRWSKKGENPRNLVNTLYFKANYRREGQTPEEKKINTIKYLLYLKFDLIQRKVLGQKGNTIFKYNGATRIYYEELEYWKINQFRKGILSYSDSYTIGEIYLYHLPEAKKILQKRFNYVFIDEMQDLEKYQIDIIDKIFIGESSSTVLQRIGDINQSIYNSGKKVKVEADWQPRNQQYLNGSNRLTKEIANVVNCFTLDRQKDENDNPRFVVNGLKKLDNIIKPHLVLFDDQSKGLLENKFKELIQSFYLQTTKEGQKYGFKIIGWNASWEDDEDHQGKLRLENIFEFYKKEVKGSKETFDSLSKYLQIFDHDKSTLEAARKAVLNSLIHILRIENKTYSTKIRGREINRYYSKNEMIKYIQNPENNCNYDFFKKIVFEWSFDLATNRKYGEVYESLKTFVQNEFKEWFGLKISHETLEFIGDQFVQFIQVDDEDQGENVTTYNSIQVDIGTVHSAKGQTHCATMYVETAYQRPTYESMKIIKANSNPLLLQDHKCNGKYDRQALKMMYVGFSRPTHLLCFACLQENITDDIENYKNSGWEIDDSLINRS